MKILVDPKAVLFLLGTEMDYKADKMQAQFIFNNPNQVSACGCGESVQLTPPRSTASFSPHRIGGRHGPRFHPRTVLISAPLRSAKCFPAMASPPTASISRWRCGRTDFRVDEQTIPQFEAEGSKPFQYQTRTKTVTVKSYWQVPARLYDDSEELAIWARAALAAAQRAALRKRPKTA